MCYVLMKCVMKYVEMVKQNEKVFTAHDFPKRQYSQILDLGKSYLWDF